MATPTRSPAEHSPRATAPGAPRAVTDGPRLGPYPVRLPKLRDPRLHVAAVTTTLQVLGQTVFDFPLSIAQILISIGTCALIELVIVLRRERVIAWPASAMLTGNGIALIMRVPGTEHGQWWSLNGWWIFAGTALLAMASKYLIRANGRHVFNPSNFALVVAFVVLGESRADPQVLWWGPLSPGLVLAFGVILVGSVAITRRVGQGHSALSFWGVFAVATAVIALSGHSITANWHVGPISGRDYWVLLVTSPEILVFLFYMITDPKTAPRGRVAQSVYGASIAAVAALIIATQDGEFGTKVGILAGLVVLCPFVRFIERRCPAPRSADDSLRAVSRRRGPATAPLTVVILAVCLTSSLVVVGNLDAEDAATVDLSRRDEVAVDLSSLPAVAVDQDLPNAAITITPELASAMGHDLVRSLELESAALANGDEELAQNGLTGTRLEQTLAAIRNASTTSVERTFDGLTATLIRIDGGPQTPPELAVRATGMLVRGDTREPFDSTFTLASVGGSHLVSNEYDQNGEPVGDQPSRNPDAIEPPVTPDVIAAGPADLGGLAFRDVTDEAGLDVDRATDPQSEGPAALGGGAAVGDYDADGDDDILLTRVGRPNGLFRNDEGRFTEVTASVGLASTANDGGSTGATFVDLNGDGRLDLLTLGVGVTPNRLFLASPDGRFVDATEQWGFPTDLADDPDAATYSLATADYDRDGRIDVLVAEADPFHARSILEDADVDEGDPCSPAARAALSGAPPGTSRTRLFRNTGNAFVDSTDRLGVTPSSLVAMSPRFADVDGDGWDDLLIAGAACTTSLLRNDRRGGFVDVTEPSGVAAAKIDTANGAELLDADGDGALDWFLSGVAYPTASGECPLLDVALGCSGNRLLLNDGEGHFTDATDRFGMRDSGWSFASVASDLNADGRVDLVVANGLSSATTELGDANRQDALYRRSADTTGRIWINRASGPWPAADDLGVTLPPNAKALVPLDADGDGRIDLLGVTPDGEPVLLRNETENEHEWLGLRVVDPGSANTQAIGATVAVELNDGTRLVRRVSSDGSFQSGRSTTVMLGLGDRSVSNVSVTWPDGTTQQFGDIPSGRLSTIVRERP